jgi:tetratricopeptide (TPR) repeat protein
VKNAIQGNVVPSQKTDMVPQNTLTAYHYDLSEKFNHAELLFSQGKYQDAIEAYDKIISAGRFINKSHWALFRKAYLLQKTGKLDSARRAWKFFSEKNELFLFQDIPREILRRI